MIYEIKNEFLTVRADTKGAILWSVTDHENWEYIWQGEEKYWNERGANLFPYIARMWEKSYTFQGKTYHMDIHGFAKDTEFQYQSAGADELVFVMEDSEETLQQYPFHFCFEVRYKLTGKNLLVQYTVENKDSKTMYFGVGGHPGFNVPMEEGLAFHDYVLEFSKNCSPNRVLFSQECFVEGKAPYILDGEKEIRLRHNLFDEDAIVLEETSGEVTLHCKSGKKGVKMSYQDMPYVGFWHMPCTDAPYVCIEPWSSLPSRQGITEELEKQENLLSLEAGKRRTLSWSIEIL